MIQAKNGYTRVFGPGESTNKFMEGASLLKNN